MRTFARGGEVPLIRLPDPPFIKALAEQLLSTFDVLDSSFATSEQVFQGTIRIVGDNELAPWEQKYSGAPRSQQLTDMAQPAIEWLQGIYPEHVPVLVQCATLPTGVELTWHVDTYMYQSVSHKVHFPLQTNLRATFETWNGHMEKKHFPVGTAIEINNILLHRAVNLGRTPRTHLIIDMMHRADLEKFQRDGVEFYHTQHPEHKLLEAQLLSQL